ncbi:MAG: peptidoglycan DD-metalloendopeptidase family protein [Deltaproteobacteria bacterium]
MHAKNGGKHYIRPAFIALLVGTALFLSAFFLLSPDASSERLLQGVSPSNGVFSGNGASKNEAIDPGEKALTRYDFRLTATDTFFSVMSVFNLTGIEINEIAGHAKGVYDLSRIKEDAVLRVFSGKDKWQRIEYDLSAYETLVVENTAQGIIAGKKELPHETRVTAVAGTIESSLYEAGLGAGADPELVMNLSDIFAWEIDFASDIQKGDTFNILYEATFVEGKPVASGKVLAAEMINNGKTYAAVYFEENGQKGGYYDADGRSLRRALLKSPLRFRRISSYFTKKRFHPILKRYRPHHGIDYAAPMGTPLESAGSGKVRFAGWRNGYGNTIEIRHNNNYATVYAHLSRIAKGVRTGASVEQGEVIGYVGSTGISTGPHLHYEVRVAGRLVNPLSIRSMPTKAIAKSEMARFNSAKQGLMARLADSRIVVASNPRQAASGRSN